MQQNVAKRYIQSSKLRLIEMAAFLVADSDLTFGPIDLSTDQSPHRSHLSNQGILHKFICIDFDSIYDQEFERIEVSSLKDKFPVNSLKEMFEKGPSDSFYLIKFSTDVSVGLEQLEHLKHFHSIRFESDCSIKAIQLSMKIFSVKNQVIEKVETVYGKTCQEDHKRLSYSILDSPMCDYMTTFISRIKKLPEIYMMNNVLENFSIMLTVTCVDSKEVLLCIGYVFEVSQTGAQHHAYKLIQ